MRILHIGKFFPPFAGGIENFLADLIPTQLEQGYKVAALVHDHQRQWHRSFAWVQPEKNHPYLLYRVPYYGRLFYAPISPHFPFWLQKILHTFQPDILHLHLPNTSAFWVLFSSLARQIPWVIHWHADANITTNRYLTWIYRTIYRPFEQRLLKHAQAIIVTSNPYLNASVALHAWQEKCHVIPLGIAKPRIQKPTLSLVQWAEQQWQNGNVRILSIGRLTYYKGYDVLIQAMTQVEGAQVCIVGHGEQQPFLSNLIQRLHISNKVKLLGYCSDAELQALLSTCDCFCLPSVDRAEAFGIALIEAMGYAKPVVTSAIPGSGVNWVVDQGKAGLLVPPYASAELADVLQRLVDQPTLRQQLSEKGFERFERFFDIQQVAKALVSVYHSSKNA